MTIMTTTMKEMVNIIFDYLIFGNSVINIACKILLYNYCYLNIFCEMDFHLAYFYLCIILFCSIASKNLN